MENANLSPIDLAEDVAVQQGFNGASEATTEQPLTIADAKRRLAATFGVNPDAIEIIVRA